MHLCHLRIHDHRCARFQGHTGDHMCLEEMKGECDGRKD